MGFRGFKGFGGLGGLGFRGFEGFEFRKPGRWFVETGRTLLPATSLATWSMPLCGFEIWQVRKKKQTPIKTPEYFSPSHGGPKIGIPNLRNPQTMNPILALFKGAHNFAKPPFQIQVGMQLGG